MVDEFDVLIIGGGATGAGVAVDAATRGLKVTLIERDDFSSGALCRSTLPLLFQPDVCVRVVIGTSSKSTKLVRGGVRHLQKAAFELDYE